jgi:hypothetical protein
LFVAFSTATQMCCEGHERCVVGEERAGRRQSRSGSSAVGRLSLG